MCVCVCIHLSTYLQYKTEPWCLLGYQNLPLIYLSVSMSIFLSIYQAIFLFIHHFIHHRSSIHLALFLSLRPSVFLYNLINWLKYLFLCWHVCLPIFLKSLSISLPFPPSWAWRRERERVRERERERERERQRQRQRDRETKRDRERQRETERLLFVCCFSLFICSYPLPVTKTRRGGEGGGDCRRDTYTKLLLILLRDNSVRLS